MIPLLLLVFLIALHSWQEKEKTSFYSVNECHDI